MNSDPQVGMASTIQTEPISFGFLILTSEIYYIEIETKREAVQTEGILLTFLYS